MLHGPEDCCLKIIDYSVLNTSVHAAHEAFSIYWPSQTSLDTLAASVRSFVSDCSNQSTFAGGLNDLLSTSSLLQASITHEAALEDSSSALEHLHFRSLASQPTWGAALAMHGCCTKKSVSGYGKWLRRLLAEKRSGHVRKGQAWDSTYSAGGDVGLGSGSGSGDHDGHSEGGDELHFCGSLGCLGWCLIWCRVA